MQIPIYQGRPLSLINRFTSQDSPEPLWLWSGMSATYPRTEEQSSELERAGFVPVLSSDANLTAIASTQITDSAYLIDPETEHAQLWLPSEHLAHLYASPISLAFTLDMPAKYNSVPMLQFLPHPQIGEYAIILGGDRGAEIYELKHLSKYARQLWQRLDRALRELAMPGVWYAHSDSHVLCTSETQYQRTLSELEQIITSRPAKETRSARQAHTGLVQAYAQVLNVRASWQREDWLIKWEDIKKMAQELTGIYQDYANAIKRSKIAALPPITSSDQTIMPGQNGGRALYAAFGPGIQPSLWNTEDTSELTLVTPNNSLLKIQGKNDGERKALYEYVTEEIGVEGLKHLICILHAYHQDTGGTNRKDDAKVTPYGLLKMMNGKADDKEEQRKIVNTLLFLARTWVETKEVEYTRSRRGRGGKESNSKLYTPLLVLEALKVGREGGIDIPEVIEFHLGKEFYDLLFGDRQQYYTLPTAKVLSYHSQKEQQEICLAFYLTSLMTINGNKDTAIKFPNLLNGSAIRLEQDAKSSQHRTRDALRVLYALEHLEQDEWYTRQAHEDIDSVLAAEYYLAECKPERLASTTLERIKTTYAFFAGKSQVELARARRLGLQSLLSNGSNAIHFRPGAAVKQRVQRVIQGRENARRRDEQALKARAIQEARKAINNDLAAQNTQEANSE